jgi:hypothetical protein
MNSEPADDYSRYHELTARMSQSFDSAEAMMKVWKELEEIKNRNAGMPPTKPFPAAALQDVHKAGYKMCEEFGNEDNK